jgi:hypothetical protein
MKLLDRIQSLAAFVSETGTGSNVCAAVLWMQLIFSVLVLFGAGMLRDFWRTTHPAGLEQPPH